MQCERWLKDKKMPKYVTMRKGVVGLSIRSWLCSTQLSRQFIGYVTSNRLEIWFINLILGGSLYICRNQCPFFFNSFIHSFIHLFIYSFRGVFLWVINAVVIWWTKKSNTNPFCTETENNDDHSDSVAESFYCCLKSLETLRPLRK